MTDQDEAAAYIADMQETAARIVRDGDQPFRPFVLDNPSPRMRAALAKEHKRLTRG